MAKLEPISAAQMKKAAKRFSHDTASTYDGLHPKHSALLADTELELVAGFLNSCEAVGLFPSQLRATITTLFLSTNSRRPRTTVATGGSDS